AGKGTRVQPLTYRLPKPMIEVMAKPVMEYPIEELAKHVLNDIMINVSHQAHRIEEYFGDGRRWGVDIGYSFEGHIEQGEVIAEPIGSAGGIKRIQEFGNFFDDTALIICGDAIIDLDLTAAVRKHWQSGAKASIVTYEVEPEKVSDYGVVVCDENGQITSFQEKPSIEDAQSNLVNTGIYFFEPEVVDMIPGGTAYDIGSELLPEVVELGLPFKAINLPFTWIDIGQLNDFWLTNQRLMRGEMRSIPIPGREVRPQVWEGLNVNVDWDEVRVEGPVYIGSNTLIEPGCELIGPIWISHGCVIRSGARIRHSMVFEHTHLGPAANVDEAMVFGHRLVDRQGQRQDSAGDDIAWVGDARDPRFKS
ncbi:MAG: NDP-sugar synthase, partial [Proteobacteria bacterium]|nr:NDP-sugar synthase [Pseudomonadota bacterium]